MGDRSEAPIERLRKVGPVLVETRVSQRRKDVRNMSDKALRWRAVVEVRLETEFGLDLGSQGVQIWSGLGLVGTNPEYMGEAYGTPEVGLMA